MSASDHEPLMRELRLLLVEDSADDAELIARILRRSGFSLTCHRVETAQAMEEALARHGWDLVIADYSLPSFDGLAALRLLRERAPDLPFILVSASVGEDTAVEAMKAGANDYVLKHNLARLRPAIERELAEARIRRAHREVESRYRNLFESVPVGVLIATSDGTVLEANPTFARMMGIGDTGGQKASAGNDRSELSYAAPPLDFQRFVRPEDRPRFEALIRQARHRAAEDEFSLVGAGGLEVAAQLSVRFTAAGESVLVCLVVTDITDRQRREEQVRRLNADLQQLIIESNAARDAAL